MVEVMGLEIVDKLNKDLRAATHTLTDTEARYLVDAYYAVQDYRKASGNQISALEKAEEPHELIDWLFEQMFVVEKQVRYALDKYSASQAIGLYAREIIGIGPVLSAGLIATIDIHKAPTVGHIWSFAGLNPNQKWEKKTKRPYNAFLKTLCWKIGESFVKVCGNQDSVYGRLYRERKEVEAERNEQFAFKDQAEYKLANFKIDKDTDAYKAYIIGKLPPVHIHSRAKRYAVKIFLSHLHEKWYRLEFGECPPKPFAIAHLGHAHYIEPEVAF